jgi:type IV pilus assembly protein PilM
MARVRIGVDIGSSAVRAVELSTGSSPPALLRIGQVPLPRGAVVAGEVRESDQVAEALKELWHRGKFRSKEVILGVANQRVVVREVTLPWLAEKELRESLSFQVQEYVPIPLDDAVLDYCVLEEFEREGRRMVRLLIVAAQRVMIGQLVQTVEAAKLRPQGLDLVPFALVRSVGSVDSMGLDNGGGDEALVDIGSDVTSICVHAQGVARFVRILPTAGRDVTAAISREVGVDEDEAERLKRGDSDDVAPDRKQEVDHAAHGSAAAFADEIRSSLDFYVSQTPGARVARVLVTGGGSKLPALLPLLAERLPTEVAAGHSFHRVTTRLDVSEDTIADAEPLLAVAVGLALPGGQG